MKQQHSHFKFYDLGEDEEEAQVVGRTEFQLIGTINRVVVLVRLNFFERLAIYFELQLVATVVVHFEFLETNYLLLLTSVY